MQEVEKLQAALAPPNYPKEFLENDITGDLMKIFTSAVDYMLNPKVRASEPDPIKRYSAFNDRYTTDAAKKFKKRPADLPRFTILRTTLVALKAMAAHVALPAGARPARPSALAAPSTMAA